MSSTSSAPVEAKSARKRKQKPEAVTASTEGLSPMSEQGPLITNSSAADTNGTELANESPFIKELGRQIRNVHKKLASSAKADSVVKENATKSIDELVAEKKLNADQKAQLLKKPALQNQLTQLEDQVKQFRSFAQELEERHNKEKAGMIQSHEAELSRAKDQAVTEASSGHSESLSGALKTVTQFLHAAASKRQSEDADSDEGRAFEGALLLVYQGNEASLSTLRSLVEGSDDKVPDVQGEPLDFTFAQIKVAASREAQEHTTSTEAEVDEVQPSVEPAQVNNTDAAIQGDPTVIHAGLTELGDTTVVPTRSGAENTADAENFVGPEQASTAGEAANAVAEANWDPQASMTTDVSANNEDWIQVPRDPAETDTGVSATPAAEHGSGSWAEEVGAAAEEAPKAEADGFEQVKRERGRGRGRGGRGDHRGRGRGGGRGDGYRGGRGGTSRGRGGASRGEKSAS